MSTGISRSAGVEMLPEYAGAKHANGIILAPKGDTPDQAGRLKTYTGLIYTKDARQISTGESLR
jgi:hypothetical protein